MCGAGKIQSPFVSAPYLTHTMRICTRIIRGTMCALAATHADRHPGVGAESESALGRAWSIAPGQPATFPLNNHAGQLRVYQEHNSGIAAAAIGPLTPGDASLARVLFASCKRADYGRAERG